MNVFRFLLQKTHRRHDTDHPHEAPRPIPQGDLGSYQENVQRIKEIFRDCNDVKLRELQAGLITDCNVFVAYIEPLVTIESVEGAFESINALTRPQTRLRPSDVSGSMEITEIDSLESAVNKVLEGWTLFFVEETGRSYVINTYHPQVRSIDRSETESTLIGPQEAFNESLQTNLSILRRQMRSPDLKTNMLKVGRYTQRTIVVTYVQGIAQQEYIDSVTQRLERLEIDYTIDGGDLAQLIDDNPFSPFPQYHMTERPERIVSHLLDGKVAILIDGSPFALSGPASFIEFFQSSEDYSNRWVSASVIRTLRLFGMFISITLSALYVAVVTYHYQLIPSDMLVSLTESRSRVPFPPLYETMLMELTIELLREAGARLPTKTGQTIGIVGGIVIGQAAVTAGLTSNILIIAVALSTIASFITPSYVMSSALRAIRFPLIVLAGLYGLYGLLIGLLLLIIHFLRLSSLGAPYLVPFGPVRLSDWKDTFIRAPQPFMIFRPTGPRPRESRRQQFRAPATPEAIPTNQAVDSDTQEGDSS